jgi:hypothetical protein
MQLDSLTDGKVCPGVYAVSNDNKSSEAFLCGYLSNNNRNYEMIFLLKIISLYLNQYE